MTGTRDALRNTGQHRQGSLSLGSIAGIHTSHSGRLGPTTRGRTWGLRGVPAEMHTRAQGKRARVCVCVCVCGWVRLRARASSPWYTQQRKARAVHTAHVRTHLLNPVDAANVIQCVDVWRQAAMKGKNLNNTTTPILYPSRKHSDTYKRARAGLGRSRGKRGKDGAGVTSGG